MIIIDLWEWGLGLNILLVDKLIQYFRFAMLQFVRFASYIFSPEKPNQMWSLFFKIIWLCISLLGSLLISSALLYNNLPDSSLGTREKWCDFSRVSYVSWKGLRFPTQFA